MKVGFWTMNTADGPGPAELGRAVADRGFESLWFGEHSHIPFGSEAYYPGDPAILPAYARMLDPILSAYAAASAAPSLVVGTAVALPLQRNFLVLAKELATLDLLTGGRFCFGVGVGWNVAELEDHVDIPKKSRLLALEERIAAIRASWRSPESGFAGQFSAFSPAMAQPGPADGRDVPVYAGLGGAVGRQHVIRWAGGWMPLDAGGHPASGVDRFRDELDEAGRDRDSCPISVVIMGDRKPERLAAYRDLGVERVIIGAGLDLGADTLRYLDRWSAIVADA